MSEVDSTISPNQAVTVQERDEQWSLAIYNGLSSEMALQNDWENMLPAERVAAAITVAEGKTAQTNLFETYQHLAPQVIEAMIQNGNFPVSHLTEDVYGAAILAVLEATRTWDPESTSFYQKAYKAIEYAVIKEFGYSDTISGLGSSHHKMRARLGSIASNPSLYDDPAEFARELGISSVVSVDDTSARRGSHADKYTPEAYVALLDAVTNQLSLDQLRESSDFDIASADNPAEEVLVSHLRQAVSDFIESSKLDFRQMAIVKMYIEENIALEKMGERLGGIKTERVRAIASKAFARLRHPDYISDIAGWVSEDN